MRRLRWTGLCLIAVVLLLAALWLARARIAVDVAQSYFRAHGIESSVEIGALGLSGVSGRFALGPAGTPDISADHLEVFFDPLSWVPRVVEVRLVRPVIRARIEADGTVRLGTLQPWIDSLRNAPGGKSRFVSDDLAVSLTGLRALLATPAGALEIDGDVKLVRNLPVSLSLRVGRAALSWQGHGIALRSARLRYDAASAKGGLQFAGTIRDPGLAAQDVTADLAAEGLHWSLAPAPSLTAARLHLTLAAATLQAGVAVTQPTLDAVARNLSAGLRDGWQLRTPSLDLKLAAQSMDAGIAASHPALAVTVRNLVLGEREANADLQVAGDAAFRGDAVKQIVTGDLARVVAGNLAHAELAFAGHVARRGKRTLFRLSAPLRLTGAAGGSVQVPVLDVTGSPDSLGVALQARLAGRGLPAVTLALPNLVWTGGGLTSDARLDARLDYAMLHGAALTAKGVVSWQSGRFAFLAKSCVPFTLAALRPGGRDLATNIHASLCGGAKPMLAGDGTGWTFSASARDAAAAVPSAMVEIDNAAATLVFTGHGAAVQGSVGVATARVADRAPSPRFMPLMGSGTVALKDNVWRGLLSVADTKKDKLADVSLSHAMADGSGTAHITATHLAFAPGQLQPEDLSPLLVAFRKANGLAHFEGDVGWKGGAITSHGVLGIAALDFLTPLGMAHAVSTDLAFSSLLPPVAAPGQKVTIARIDWTVPFGNMEVHFGFDPATVKIGSINTEFAGGHAALGAFAVALAHPGAFAGTADLASIQLAPLITASNLGDRVKLDGTFTAHIPFTAGPEGLHISNGHLAADGPGRLSINRSLWTQGGAVAANAVQDFAYQALENLAFDQMTAELNSVSGGRLQVVFHIKGHSDPPTQQKAEIAITDLINGTALQKPVPLPSGTPIDLTLDTSLNFDELLQSYTQAWSKALNQAAGAAQ